MSLMNREIYLLREIIQRNRRW